MTEEDSAFAIAEFCGIKWKRLGDGVDYPYSPDGSFPCVIPDYPRDLNAIHEAESRLMDGEHECLWICKLIDITGAGVHSNPALYAIRIARATAAQRAEALLRAIGKWKD